MRSLRRHNPTVLGVTKQASYLYRVEYQQSPETVEVDMAASDLVVPPPMAATLPPRLQELLGYNIHPPFIGYVDGRHPQKLLNAATVS